MPADFTNYSNYNKDNNFESVKFGTNAKLLEVELNEMQNIQAEARAEIVRDSIHSGFIQLSDLDYATMTSNPNLIKLINKDTLAYVNGYKITIPAGTIINLDAPPVDVSREDLVFLEVWKEEIDYTEVIGAYGKAETANTLPNKLLDSRIGKETARRVQLKWRIRVVDRVDFSTYSADGFCANTNLSINGVYNPLVTPQGGNSAPVPYAFDFKNMFTNPLQRDNFSMYPKSDMGLYVAGVGDQASKDTLKTVDGYVYAIPMFRVHRRPSCGYLAKDSYSKTSPLIPSIHTQRITSGSKVASTEDGSLQVSINGNTLVNLMGKLGNCESLNIADWSWIGSMALSASYKMYGTSSIKGTATSSPACLFKNIPCDQTHKYFVSNHLYIAAYTSGNIGINAGDYSVGGNFTTVLADVTKLNKWQRISTIVTGKLHDGMQLYLGCLQNAVCTFYIDGVMIYDLTAMYGAGNEPSDIALLEKTLPFVDGIQSSKPMAIKARGKNLLDNKIYSYKSSDVSETVKGFMFPANLGARVAVFNPSLVPNKTYTLSFVAYTASGTAKICADVYPDDYPEILAYAGNSISTTPTRLSGTITIPQNYVDDPNVLKGIRIYTPASQGSASAIYVEDIMLCEGTDTAFAPFKASQVIMPSGVFSDLKKIGNAADSIDLVRKVYKKNISDWLTLNNYDTFVTSATFSGYKRIAFVDFVTRYGAIPNSAAVLVVKNTGAPLLSKSYDNLNGVEQIGTAAGGLHIMLSNSDTGWSDSYSPSNDELKAYFNGWKMCHDDGSTPYLPSVIPYTASTWAEWTKGLGTITTDSTGLEITASGTNSVIATVPSNCKPSTKYGILYNVVSQNLVTTVSMDCAGSAAVYGKALGNNKLVVTTPSTISSNIARVWVSSAEPAGNKIKIKDIRIFELPVGTQIETDFNTLTADQLATKYSFMGTCAKRWKKVTNNSDSTSNLPTTSYAEYTPYKMIYQLATPVETDIKDLVKGRLYVNDSEPFTFDVTQVTTKQLKPTLLPNMITNSDFSNGTTGWITSNTSAITVSNNVAKFTATTINGYIFQTIAGGTVIGHQYYMRAIVKANSNLVRLQSGTSYGYHSGSGNFEPLSTILYPSVNNHGIAINDGRASGWSEIQVMQVYTVDLTDLFGSGNEPNREWCDKYLEFKYNGLIKSPAGTTMLGVLNNKKKQYLGARANVCILPASKWGDGLFEAFYKEAPETHVTPSTALIAGEQTLNISTTIDSTTLTSSNVPYKKNGDGAKDYLRISLTEDVFIAMGTVGQLNVINASEYTSIKVGEKYWNGLSGTSYREFIVVSKDSNNKISVLNTSISDFGISVTSFYYYRASDRQDGYLSNIVYDVDISGQNDLRHKVSLTGFDYQQLLEENFDKLLRAEL